MTTTRHQKGGKGPMTVHFADAVDEETKQVTSNAIAAAQEATPFWQMDPQEVRQARRAQYLAEHATHFGSATTIPAQREDRILTVTMTHHDDDDDDDDDASSSHHHHHHTVPVSIFRPTTENNNKNAKKIIRGVYLLMHGGGWYFGEGAWQNDIRLCKLCDDLQIAVISVDYRLAPEHKWPAPRDDCVAAAVWLVQNAQQEFGTTNLMIGGESAGAHLCMTTLLQLPKALGLVVSKDDPAADATTTTTTTRTRTKSTPLPFKCANLVYGIYDLGGTPSMRNYGSRPLVFNYDDFVHCTSMLLPNADTIDRRSPDISPLYANLVECRCLPPALFSVGTDDGLLDDTLFMANRWAAAGLETKLAVYPGGAHGVGHFGPHAQTVLGKQCHGCIEDFLASFSE